MSSTNPFELQAQAASGFSKAAEYDTHRPTYPSSAVTSLLSHLHLTGHQRARIIDLASGTGKFTERLAAREERFEIVAVEPHAGMRGELERKQAETEKLGETGLERVRILEGNAEEIPVGDGWADGVVTAQAFHWFANESSLKEIHRVLKPGSAFGMIWNVEDYNSPKSHPATSPWEQALKDIIAGLEDGAPRYRHLRWKEIFDDQLSSTPLQALADTVTGSLPLFSLPLGEEWVKWKVWLSDEGVWNRYATLSQIANLEGETLVEVKRKVFEALKGEGTERDEDGLVAVHGFTHLAWTSRV